MNTPLLLHFAAGAAWAALAVVPPGFAPPAAAASLTVVGAFNATDGATSTGDVTIDSQGNLFGTTQGGGSHSSGVVWEIVHGTTVITPLASFTSGAGGQGPIAGVVRDSQGNLFGTTQYGGSSGFGTVWELPQGSGTITVLASFNNTNGEYPQAGLTLDHSGNLFGTAVNGGAFGKGLVFKLAQGSGTITPIASFTGGMGGAFPYGGVTLDGSGNLYGTAEAGGSSSGGLVWEIAHDTSTIMPLASFASGVGGFTPYAGVTQDSQGNLYGTTNSGGGDGSGTVWKLTPGSGIITVLASFDHRTTGQFPRGGVTIDGAGNLFGTTTQGGAGAGGTVWEIARGTTSLTAVVSLSSRGPSDPMGGLTLDSQGNLFGTANVAYGEVFEVSGAAIGPGGHTPLLWNNVTGQAALWNIAADGSYTNTLYGPFSGWTAKAVSEAPDGSVDLLWTNANGTASLWNITGSGYTSIPYGPFPGYSAVSLSVGSDGNPRLLWDKTDGTALLWTINPTNGAFTYTSYGPFAGWTANQVASGATVTDLLWTNTNGTAAGWRINNANGTYVTHAFGPYSGYGAVGLSAGPDNGAHLLWDSTGGIESLWNSDFTTGGFTYTAYGPYSGYTAKAIATGPDGGTRMLWDKTDGTASLWTVTGSGYTHTEHGPFSGWTAVGVSAGP